jgi:O-6-methylguanine DNA methyltransferase
VFTVIASEAGVCWLGTPLGDLEDGLRWTRRWLQFSHLVEGEHCAPLQVAADELRRYFSGERLAFSCPLDLHGTPFQLQVWHALAAIPYGETRSYAQIAECIARPSACRAVGAANGANPISVILPCHRVIGSSGLLTGYGGGLPTKAWLLQLEGVSSRF